MNDDLLKDAPPLVAAVKEKPKHESRVRMDQAVNREIQEAVERKQYEIAAALGDAGVPINRFPNTPEGAKALAWCMKLMDIQIQKLMFAEDTRKSGYYIYRLGELAAFIPCERVRGVWV